MKTSSGEETREIEKIDQASSVVGVHYNDWMRELMNITRLKPSQMTDITPYDAYFGGMTPSEYARYIGSAY